MEIRRIAEADWPALGETVAHVAAIGEFKASSDPTGAFFMKSLRFAPHPVAGAFDDDGGLMGFISPEFKVIVVRPPDRRQGVGRALVEAGFEIERERRHENLLIGVLPDDLAGKAFLEATGFGHHSTLWDLGLPTDLEVPAPAWPGVVVARTYDRSRDDASFVGLFNVAFATHPTPMHLELDDIRAANDDPSIVDEDALVLEDLATGELIGFCATQPEREDGRIGRQGEIWTIGVLPGRQGHGLGRQLLRWGIRRLRSVGASDVTLSVNGRNATALGLYLDEGFVQRRTRERWARPVPEAAAAGPAA